MLPKLRCVRARPRAQRDAAPGVESCIWKPPLGLQDEGELRVTNTVARLDLHRLPRVEDGFVDLALLAEHHGKRAMRRGIEGALADQHAQLLGGRTGIPAGGESDRALEPDLEARVPAGSGEPELLRSRRNLSPA